MKEFTSHVGDLLSGNAGIIIYGTGENQGKIEMGNMKNGQKEIQVLDLGNPENVFDVLNHVKAGADKDAFESLGKILTDDHPVHTTKIRIDGKDRYYYEKSKYKDIDGNTLYYSPYQDDKFKVDDGGYATLFRAETFRDKKTGDFQNYGLVKVNRKYIKED